MPTEPDPIRTPGWYAVVLEDAERPEPTTPITYRVVHEDNEQQ